MKTNIKIKYYYRLKFLFIFYRIQQFTSVKNIRMCCSLYQVAIISLTKKYVV